MKKDIYKKIAKEVINTEIVSLNKLRNSLDANFKKAVEEILNCKKGKIILSDDDSGGNYNFAIHQKLPPGDYILSVKHCCFGEGPFSLTFKQDPAIKTRPAN